MGEMRNTCKILSETLTGRNHAKDLDIDRMIILKWILEKQGTKAWIEFIWFRIGTSDRLLRCIS
jgi:hypothetical protein